MSLLCLSVKEMREGLLRKDFSAKELTEAHLTRIRETNPNYNSFILVSEDRARLAAARADERLEQEREAAPELCGIPLGLKDMILEEGVESRAASKILEGFIPPYSSTAVQKLQKAGAVILGRCNQDEFGMGSSNENSAYGPVKNPWNETKVPGGSSGGSATAVALGQVPLSLGTDTGGSVRQPAAFCGCVGVKPTYGRISRWGVVAFASSLDQIGVFSRDTTDAALLLQTIAGYDPLDSTSMQVAVPNYVEEISRKRSLRIGIPKEYFQLGVAPEIETAVQDALGAECVEISLPHTEYALASYYIVVSAEAASNLSRYDGVRYGRRANELSSLQELYAKTREEGFGPEVKRRILMGNYVLSAGYYDAYYKKAQQMRTLIIRDFQKAFSEKCDIIAAPTTPSTAFAPGERNLLDMYKSDVFTVPASLAGLPAMSLPVGLDAAGLPIGLQLIAPAFEEARLFCAAKQIEDKTSFPNQQQTRKDS